MPKLSF